MFEREMAYYVVNGDLDFCLVHDASINIHFVDIMCFCKGNIKLNSAIFAFGSGLKIPFPFYSRIFQSILKPSKIWMNAALMR